MDREMRKAVKGLYVEVRFKILCVYRQTHCVISLTVSVSLLTLLLPLLIL